MNCDAFEELMAGLLAGDATREERARIEAHLLDCAACREAFATAKAGWEGAKAIRVAGLPEAVDRRVVAALQPKSGWEKFFRVGTGIAAGIILAVGLFRSMPAPVEPQRAPAVLAMVKPSSLGTLYAVDPDTQRPVGELSIQKLSVSVEILDGVAQTTVEEVFFNETDSRLEGTFRFPLPPDASITRLAMEIDGKLMEGEVVERQKARQTYEGIVRRMKDPALLEWMPGGMFSCRIFPIEAKQPKRILIGYQQALAGFDGKMQYVYPLVSETTSTREIGTFVFNAVAKGATITGAKSIEELKFHAKKDVVLEIEMESEEASLVVHRDTFNLFLEPKADALEAARPRAGTIFIVDCSAAMNEPTLDVARRVVEKLIDASPGGTVQVIGFNIAGEFSQATKQSSIEKLFALKAGGALDFGQAVRTAMAACPDGGEVVFVGGGTPSWGETDAAKIVKGGRAACGTKQVTFRAVAVGSGADRPTLGAVASAFSGGVQAISPSDDVNARLTQIARTAGRAAMTDVKVEFDGKVEEVAPAQLGSLYFGERLLVTGRCSGTALKAVLTGKVQGRAVRREWTFALPAEEKGNLFVKRLWAQRRLADLMGKGEAAKEEITKLGVACQIMTPFTSFLVLESEKAYEEHAIERKKKEEERLVRGEAASNDETTVPPDAGPTGKFGGEGRSFRLPVAGEKSWEGVTDYLKVADDRTRGFFGYLGGVEIPMATPGTVPDVNLGVYSLDFRGPDINTKKLLGDFDVTLRQAEVQQAQIQDLLAKVEDYRAKLAGANSRSATGMQELEYARKETVRLSKQLAELEEAHIALARGTKTREEVLATLHARGVDTSNAPPLKALEGKVTAGDDSIGMVVLSIGANDGVSEGGEFTIYRGGNFIAKITINQVTARWCAGRVTLKKEAPRVGDDASNSIIVAGEAAARQKLDEVDAKASYALHLLRSVKAQK